MSLAAAQAYRIQHQQSHPASSTASASDQNVQFTVKATEDLILSGLEVCRSVRDTNVNFY
jgi:hypothetical protein